MTTPLLLEDTPTRLARQRREKYGTVTVDEANDQLDLGAWSVYPELPNPKTSFMLHLQIRMWKRSGIPTNLMLDDTEAIPPARRFPSTRP